MTTTTAAIIRVRRGTKIAGKKEVAERVGKKVRGRCGLTNILVLLYKEFVMFEFLMCLVVAAVIHLMVYAAVNVAMEVAKRLVTA